MNRMNDFRHLGALGCKSPDDAGLAAVRVHDVRLERLERALELSAGAPIAPRPDGPNEMGDGVEQVVDGFDERLEGAFRAGGGTAVKPDIDTRFFAQTKNGGNSVFLRAADD